MVAERLGVKVGVLETKSKCVVPWRKRRLEGHIKELRRDLSRIEQMSKGAMKDSDMKDRLEKYKVRGKGITVIKEEIKQRENNKDCKGKEV